MSDGQGWAAIGQGLANVGSVLGRHADTRLRSMQQTQNTMATISLQQGLSQIEKEFEQELQNNVATYLGTGRAPNSILSDEFRETTLPQRLDEEIQRAMEGISTPGGRAAFTNSAATIKAQYEELWVEKERNAVVQWQRAVTPKTLNDLIAMHESDPEVGVMKAQSDLQLMVEAGVWSLPQAEALLEDFKKGIAKNTAMSYIRQPLDENGEVIEDINEGHAASAAKIDELFGKSLLGMNAEDRRDLLNINDQNREARIEVLANELDTANIRTISSNIPAYVGRGFTTQQAMQDVDLSLWNNEQYNMLDPQQQTKIRNNAWAHLTRLLPSPDADATPAQRMRTVKTQWEAGFWAIANEDIEQAEAYLNELFDEDMTKPMIDEWGVDFVSELHNHFMGEIPGQEGELSRAKSMMTGNPLRGRANDPALAPYYTFLRENNIDPDGPMGRQESGHLALALGLPEGGTAHSTKIDPADVFKYVEQRSWDSVGHFLDESFFERWFGGGGLDRIAAPGAQTARAGEMWNTFGESSAGVGPLRDAISRIAETTSMTAIDGSMDLRELEVAVLRGLGVPRHLGIDNIEEDMTRQWARSLLVGLSSAHELINAVGGKLIHRYEMYDNYNITNIGMEAGTNNLIVHLDFYNDGRRAQENRRLLIDTMNHDDIQITSLASGVDFNSGAGWGTANRTWTYSMNELREHVRRNPSTTTPTPIPGTGSVKGGVR